MKKISLIIIVAVLLTACSANNYESGNSFDGATLNSAMAPAATPAPAVVNSLTEDFYFEGEMYLESYDTAGGLGSDEASYSASYPDISLTDPNRKLIRSANLNIESQAFDESVSNLEALCASFQGFVESSSVSGTSITFRGKQFRSASYIFRIPSKFYRDFLTTVGTIGNVTNKSEESQDVTDSYFDTESRINVLILRRDRLYKLLETETNSKSIIEFENSLSETLYEIDRMTSTLKRYDSLVDYSTIHVYLTEVEEYTEVSPYTPAPKTVGERISAAFGESVESISIFLTDVFVFLVGNIIYILILLAIIVIIMLTGTKIYRKRQKRREAQQEKNEEGE